MDLRYIGHSAFEVKLANNSILIDPYVSVNPNYNWRESNITDIFITHAHGDHLGQAIEIAKDDAGVIPIPDDGTFMDGSWEVDCFDEDYLREWYNGNQKDNIKELF